MRSLELEVIVSQVPGVVEVNGLRLFQLQSGGTYQPLTINASGNSELILESWELPELLQVLVTAGTDGSGVAVATSLTPEVQTDNTYAVPIVQTVC